MEKILIVKINVRILRNSKLSANNHTTGF